MTKKNEVDLYERVRGSLNADEVALWDKVVVALAQSKPEHHASWWVHDADQVVLSRRLRAAKAKAGG